LYSGGRRDNGAGAWENRGQKGYQYKGKEKSSMQEKMLELFLSLSIKNSLKNKNPFSI